ncbi:hypothetical protein JCM10213v2_004610 [Rhodosporidiobolus nylandii]
MSNRPQGNLPHKPPQSNRPPQPSASGQHRPEDLQTAEALTANRRPTQPPQLFPLGQIKQQQAQREREREERAAMKWATGSNAQGGSSRGWGGAQQRGGAAAGGQRAGAGAGAQPAIRPPRLNRGRGVAGSWADSSSSSAAYGGNGKGKEREQPVGGGGYAAFLAAEREKQPTPIPVPQNPRATLFVQGLPPGVDEKDVERMFMPFGKIERINVTHKDPSYTYAHVAFTSQRSASAALTALNLEPFVYSRPPTPSASTSTHQTAGEHILKIQYRDPNPAPGGALAAQSRRVSAQTAAERAVEEQEQGLFRERETPAPASQSQSGLVKAEPNASPVKPAPAPVAASAFGTPTTSAPFVEGAKALPRDPGFQANDADVLHAPTLKYRGHELPPAGLAKRTGTTPSLKSFAPHTFNAVYPLPSTLSDPSERPPLNSVLTTQLEHDYSITVVQSLVRPGPDGRELAMTLSVPAEVVRRRGRRKDGTRDSRVARKLAKAARKAENKAKKAAAKRAAVEGGEADDNDGEQSEDTLMSREAGEEDEELDELDEDDAEDVQRMLRPPSAGPSSSAATSNALAASASASSSTAPHPPPAAAAAPQPDPALTADGESSMFDDDDGTQCEGVLLPSECTGEDAAAKGRRTRFLIQQVKRLAGEGKVVLSNSIEGDYLMLNYILDESAGPPPASTAPITPATSGFSSSASPAPLPAAQPAAPAALPPPPRPAALTRTTTTTSTQQALAGLHVASAPSAAAPVQDVEMEDVKPVISRPALRQPQARMEIDEQQTPSPALEVARFPLQIASSSRADTRETSQVAQAFINEYFRRFDTSRASLEPMYNSGALFSLRLCTAAPPRARGVLPFQRRWHDVASKRFCATPFAITNAIRMLPEGSTDLDKVVFTARSVPELLPGAARKQVGAPVLIHALGEFEEFPEKVVRRFSRTFILVRKSARTTGAAGPEYWIESDQLSIFHRVEGEPRALPLADQPFTPSKHRAAPTPAAVAAAPPTVVASTSLTPHAFPPSSAVAQFQGFAGSGFQPNGGIPPRQPARPPPPQQPQPVASTSRTAPLHQAQRRTEAQQPAPPRPRPAASANPVAPPSAPRPQSTPARAPAPDSDIIILSDSDSVASNTASRSPELYRRPAPLPSSKSLGKRRAVDEPDAGSSSSSAGGGAGRATQRPRTEASLTSTQAERDEAERLSREDIQRLVQLEVQRLVASGAAPAPAAVSSPDGDGRKKTKQKEKEREKAPKPVEKEKAPKGKTKEKPKEKEPPALGTGLGQGDGRIVIPHAPTSHLHGFDGKANKLRHMVQTSPTTFLATSFLGEIVEFSHAPGLNTSRTTKVQNPSGDDRFRVEESAWSDAKQTLVVGFLGSKVNKVMLPPPNQIVLYKQERSPEGAVALHETAVDHKPHADGGVTSVTVLPGSGRMRFVTAGEDKKYVTLFLWERSRATQEFTTQPIPTQHSSTITSLAVVKEQNRLISGGMDKRLFAYDLEGNGVIWQALLPNKVMTVSSLAMDPNLVLARMASTSAQFAVHDLRLSSHNSSVMHFGYDLPPHRNTAGALVATTMTRYLRGDICDTILAFPDSDHGVKLWDLRSVRSSAAGPLKQQHLSHIGTSKVVQASFASRSELCTMELSHFTRLPVKG